LLLLLLLWLLRAVGLAARLIWLLGDVWFAAAGGSTSRFGRGLLLLVLVLWLLGGLWFRYSLHLLLLSCGCCLGWTLCWRLLLLLLWLLLNSRTDSQDCSGNRCDSSRKGTQKAWENCGCAGLCWGRSLECCLVAAASEVYVDAKHLPCFFARPAAAG
jgi:hypothetical protein